MAVMRLDPFAGFERMFETLYGHEGSHRPMPIDIYRKGNEYRVEMDLPGADPASLDVNVERNMLTVNAEAKSMHDDADEQIVCERRHAHFSRQVYLGENLDTDNVKASFENGVLTVTIPVSEKAPGRHIEVSTGNGAHEIEAKDNTTG